MKNFILFLCLFTQIALGCDDVKKEDSSGLKIRGRGRAGSFLEPFDEKLSSESTPSFIYRSPRPSQKSTLAAYNALLENTLQPSERIYPSLSEEIGALQKFWDSNHTRNLSSELRAELGRKPILLLHVGHIFKPQIRTLDSTGPKIHGFHHDPERLLEKSGLLKVERETQYPDACYKQHLLTKTDPAVHAKKTLFPDSWSRQETLSALLAALQNATKSAPDEDAHNKEFTGTAATVPPISIIIRIKVLPDRAFITTLHPKH